MAWRRASPWLWPVAVTYVSSTSSASRHPVARFLIWEEKTNKQRNSEGHPHFWTATILWTCPVCPVEMSRLSCGHSVLSVWNYTQMRSGRPGCPGNRPQTVPGDTAYRPPNSFICSLSVFLLPMTPRSPRCQSTTRNDRIIGSHHYRMSLTTLQSMSVWVGEGYEVMISGTQSTVAGVRLQPVLLS